MGSGLLPHGPGECAAAAAAGAHGLVCGGPGGHGGGGAAHQLRAGEAAAPTRADGQRFPRGGPVGGPGSRPAGGQRRVPGFPPLLPLRCHWYPHHAAGAGHQHQHHGGGALAGRGPGPRGAGAAAHRLRAGLAQGANQPALFFQYPQQYLRPHATRWRAGARGHPPPLAHDALRALRNRRRAHAAQPGSGFCPRLHHAHATALH